MEDWLNEVRQVAKPTPVSVNVKRSAKSMRHEYRRLTPMVKRMLFKLATTYWPDCGRWTIRISPIPHGEGTAPPSLFGLWHRMRNPQGWRVVHLDNDECFEVYLVHCKRGFVFELSNDFRTEDTSEEQLQVALCQAAINGPTEYVRRSYGFY